MTPRRDGRAGFSLVETAIGVTVLSTALCVVLFTTKSAQDGARSGERRTEATDRARLALAEIAAEVEESALATVDCLFRSHATGGSDWSDTRSFESGGRRQCLSSTCAWSAPGGAPFYPHSYCSQRYYTSGSSTLTQYGRLWAPQETQCPKDGTYLSSGAYVPALKLFSPRDAGGTFVSADYTASEAVSGLQGKADWQAIVVYMPYYNAATGKTELRRHVAYKSDLFAAASQGASGWTAWSGNSPANLPAMLDLVDFGQDGTPDGVPDGKLPLTPQASDAQNEYFLATSSVTSGVTSAYFYWYKYYNAGGKYRYFYLYVDRTTGLTTWQVYFADNNFAQYWYRYASFTRAPRVVAADVAGADFSTATSNPWNAVTNPGGMQNTKNVRLTLVVDGPGARAGAIEYPESVQTLEVAPRNS